MTGSPAPSLIDLVARALEALERDGPVAVDALCAQYPQQAEALRVRLAELEEAGMLPTRAVDAVPESLGAFRLLRRLGGGGMGVVYEAIQEPMGRLVALKLLRPDQLYFPGARERFSRELAAIARLAHPGIVPVFAAGEEQGLPYFAMERVSGATLEELLVLLRGRDPARLSGRELREALAACVASRGDEPRGPRASDVGAALFEGTWVAACLRLARQVAEALAHAHERGVLHRDVKPSNIMLTLDGRALLLDFGLARAAGEQRLTTTGSHLGSLAFMSPEQMRGEHAALDGRSDVYSLGVTLYELLTLRAPFVGDDLEATRRRVLEGRALPPRRLNSALPRDAETVLLTAMDRDRERRYADASAFASDLANVLGLRPVQARPAGAVLRARRWAQRRPAAAVALVLGALLLLAGPLGWELQRVRMLDELAASRDRAEADFAAALSAIGHVLRETAVEELRDVPRMQRARLAALDRALELLDSLGQERRDDPLVMQETAALRAARGSVLRDLGRPEQGLAEYDLAIELGRLRLAREPGPDRGHELALLLEERGRALAVLGRNDAARVALGEALALERDAIAAQPSDALQLELAGTLVHVADALVSAGALDDADAALAEARVLTASRLQQEPDSPELLTADARVLDSRAELARRRERPAEALLLAAQALEVERLASALAPDDRELRFRLVTGLHTSARFELDLGRTEDAEAHLSEALAGIDGLVAEFPDSGLYRRWRGDVLEQLAIAAGRRGDNQRAYELLASTVAAQVLACEAEPERADLALDLAQTNTNMANALMQLGRDPDEARRLLERARELLAPLLSASDATLEARELSRGVEYLALLFDCQHDRLDGIHVALLTFGREVPARAWPQRMAADLWSEWFAALRRDEPAGPTRSAREDEARQQVLEHLARAVALGYDDLAELEGNPALDPFRGEPTFRDLMERAGESARRP